MRRAALLVFALLPAVCLVGNGRPVAAAGQPAAADKAVVAFLDGLYGEIAAAHPNPERYASKGLYKPPPIADSDRIRGEYHVASGLSEVLGYDFVKLAVIEEYRYRFRMFQLIAKLPGESAGVRNARDVAEMLWLCDTPNPLTLDRREADVIRHTDGYLSRVVPANLPVKERGAAVLEAFARACMFGRPASTMPPIRRPLGESPMFAKSVTFAGLTGLSFEQIGRVESTGGPLVLYGLARALPKEYPGRDQALAAMRSDKEWTYPPR